MRVSVHDAASHARRPDGTSRWARAIIFSNANTVILMGRVRGQDRMGRALHVAKHRGSACGDEVVPYRINDKGLELAGADGCFEVV